MVGSAKKASIGKVIESKDLKAFLKSTKVETRLIGPLQRHLLARPRENRRHDNLHPSEIVKTDWCSLASYHALNGDYIETEEKPSLRLQSIFDEGHTIHAKWQNWIKEMGKLYGNWECDICFVGWIGISSDKCPECSNFSKSYKEVEAYSVKHHIRGNADGIVIGLGEDFLIEIKSIGIGTIRVEAPTLLMQADGDLDKAWRNIRQPFRTHQLQGQVYMHCRHLMVEEGLIDSAPDELVFIYELKANQDYKEFRVKYNPGLVHDIFEKALDIVWAVDNKVPPQCSIDSVKGCKRCAPYREVVDEH